MYVPDIDELIAGTEAVTEPGIQGASLQVHTTRSRKAEVAMYRTLKNDLALLAHVAAGCQTGPRPHEVERAQDMVDLAYWGAMIDNPPALGHDHRITYDERRAA